MVQSKFPGLLSTFILIGLLDLGVFSRVLYHHLSPGICDLLSNHIGQKSQRNASTLKAFRATLVFMVH